MICPVYIRTHAAASFSQGRHGLARGFETGRATDKTAMPYWENEGENLVAHQQDWTVNGVKIAFVASND